MAVGYKDFLTDAKEFLVGASGEIRFRNSMSRAYYALYHIAVEHADEIHLPAVSSLAGPVHKNLRAFYMDGLYSDKVLQSKMKRVGYSLKVLHEGRCKADYELGESVAAIDADLHYQRCEANVRLVEELRAARAA